jgi:exopolysaccharide biosynthesis polyprenyl glycosylphosphotransferase
MLTASLSFGNQLSGLKSHGSGSGADMDYCLVSVADRDGRAKSTLESRNEDFPGRREDLTLPARDVADPGANPLSPTSACRQPNDSNWRGRYAKALIGLDLVALLSGFMVASFVRFGQVFSKDTHGIGHSYIQLAFFAALGWSLTMAASGAYSRKAVGLGPEEYRRVCEGTIRFLALVAVAVFLTTLNIDQARVVITVFLAFVLAMCFRHWMRVWLYRQRLRGRFRRGVLVVGTEASVRLLSQHFWKSDAAEFLIVGVCIPRNLHQPERTHLQIGHRSLQVLGEPTEAGDATLRVGANTIAVADADALSPAELKKLAKQIEGTDTELMAVPSLTDVAGPRITVRQVAGLPLLYVGKPELHGRRRLTKDIFERLVALVALILVGPFLLIAGLVVRLTSPGPALFRQYRVGLNGKRFIILKLRTMVIDADQRLAEVRHLNEIDHVLFKARRDPRVTSVGRFLRRWSLDELPQLWNVLRGDMSLVGPRPPLPEEVEKYADETHRRLLVKPGITGLWQVSGRSALSWDESIQLDLHYVDNWSLTLDVILLVKTLKAVLLRRGAW